MQRLISTPRRPTGRFSSAINIIGLGSFCHKNRENGLQVFNRGRDRNRNRGRKLRLQVAGSKLQIVMAIGCRFFQPATCNLQPFCNLLLTVYRPARDNARFMTEFFHVLSSDEFIQLLRRFDRLPNECVPLDTSLHRVLSEEVIAPENLPEGARLLKV